MIWKIIIIFFMFKIFTFFICFLFFSMPAFADFLPSYVNHNIYYGIGVISIKNEVKVYELDDDKAPVAAIINGGKIFIKGVNSPKPEDTYLAYLKNSNISLLSVEQDTDEWYYVCYNQQKKLFGWIKKSENIDFIDWESFFNFYGRKRGVYIFADTRDCYKKLYSSPDLESTVVDDFKFAKHVALWLVKGDWMLVKVTTYDGYTKTGWIRWRLKNGSLIAFPDFKN